MIGKAGILAYPHAQATTRAGWFFTGAAYTCGSANGAIA
jgi:hypothetical protein